MNAIAEARIDQGMDGMSTAPVNTGSDAEGGFAVLGAGVYTLEATGADSRLKAVTPLEVTDS